MGNKARFVGRGFWGSRKGRRFLGVIILFRVGFNCGGSFDG